MEENIMEDLNSYYLCDSCDASFKISHSLDPVIYTINHCPFCSSDNLEVDEIIEE
jgi:Zn finger protein HypA/HybF involved in hydrogenase expression